MRPDSSPGRGIHLGSFSHRVGRLVPISELGELREDPDSLGYMQSLGLARFSRISGPLLEPVVECMRATLGKARLAPSDIQALIYFSSTFDAYKDYDIVAKAAAILGLANCIPFGSFLGQCTNYSQALWLARAALASGQAERILLVTADRLDESLSSRILPSRTGVFSDVVAACLVDGLGEGAFVLEGLEHVYMPAMSGVDPSKDILHYLTEYSRAYSTVFKRLREGLGLLPDAFSRVVAANHNLSVLRNLAALAQCGFQKVFVENIAEYGHCFGADQLISLETLDGRGALRPGERILVTGSGGHLWSAAALRR